MILCNDVILGDLIEMKYGLKGASALIILILLNEITLFGQYTNL